MVSNLSNCDENSILLFEYFTANGINDMSIISEATGMIKELADDLKHLDIYLLVSKKFKNLFEDLEVQIIFIDEPLILWLEKNACKFKKSIFIADEGDEHLFNITKILEDNNLKLYCSNSESILTCTNKYLTHEMLKNLVNQPLTYKIKIDSFSNFKNEILSIYNEFNKYEDTKLIIKPIDGVDCEKVSLISKKEDLINFNNIYPEGTIVLIQKYVEGYSCSVSLLTDGNHAIPLSLNKQNIVFGKKDISYCGGELPFNHPLKNQAFKLATEAVETVKGLKGFVGVDLILGEEVTFLEINSRFTTPYVGLKKLVNFNIGETIINLLDNKINIQKLKENIILNGKVKFTKEENELKIEKFN